MGDQSEYIQPVHLGSYHFLPGAGLSVCDCRSPIFSGPPLACAKKF